MAQGVAAPGLLGHRGRDTRFCWLHREQIAFGAVAGGIEAGHIDAGYGRQLPEPFGPGSVPACLQGIDEGWQQQFAIAQQHHIKKWCQRLGVGGEHRPTTEHDRIVFAALGRPDRDALLLQQIQQHRSIQLPAQRQAKQVAVAVRWISLVGE